MTFNDKKLQESFENISNCFCGTDGGIRFVNFKTMLQRFEESAAKNDQSALMLIGMVHQFSRLIDAANSEIWLVG